MVWTCGACTFDNDKDDARSCQICNTPATKGTRSPVMIDLTTLSSEKSKPAGGQVRYVASMETARSRKKRKRSSEEKDSKQIAAHKNDARKQANDDSARKRGLPSEEKKNARLRVQNLKVELHHHKPHAGEIQSSTDNPKSQRNKTKTNEDKKLSQMNLFGAVVKPAPTNSASTASSKSKSKDPPEKNEIDPGVDPCKQTSLLELDMPFSMLWENAMKCMKETFCIESLRNLQPQAVECALKRKSQIIVMATGGGKSLCYQLPALCLPGLTLVISPLIALMTDQVQALLDKGVAAAMIASSCGQRHNTEVMNRLRGRRATQKKENSKQCGEISLKPVKVLYGTPELVQTERFRTVLRELCQKKRLALFAIDEAHCLSTWGHDFRPAYRKLSWLRETFPSVPCMACTATATPKVITDIRETLALKGDAVPCHMGSFNRPNINYQVRFKDTLDGMSLRGAMGDLVDLVKNQHQLAADAPCSGIIYVHKRHDTTMLAREVTKQAKIKAAAYHAGLKDSDRAEVQRQWTNGTIKVAVATVAFGMGIDLPHVRYVVHWSIAKSIDGFYQETGRAGRDGKSSLSVVYYSKDDASKFSYLLLNNKKPNSRNDKSTQNGVAALESMVNYCTTPCCRRQYLLSHYGETVKAAEVCRKTCDFCKDPRKVEHATAASAIGKQFLNAGGRVGRRSQQTTWDGQCAGPHGDASDDKSHAFNDWHGDALYIDMPQALPKEEKLGSGIGEKPTTAAFVKASQTLAKYERMECQEGTTNGFVNFRAKLSSAKTKSSGVVIPEHLRSHQMPDPLAHLAAPATKSSPNSSALSAQAAAMKSELEQLKEKREVRLKALQEKKRGPTNTKPAPPPKLSFQGKKRSRHH